MLDCLKESGDTNVFIENTNYLESVFMCLYEQIRNELEFF